MSDTDVKDKLVFPGADVNELPVQENTGGIVDELTKAASEPGKIEKVEYVAPEDRMPIIDLLNRAVALFMHPHTPGLLCMAFSKKDMVAGQKIGMEDCVVGIELNEQTVMGLIAASQQAAKMITVSQAQYKKIVTATSIPHRADHPNLGKGRH